MSNSSATSPTSAVSLTARQRSALVLIAATLVTLPFGTIYAFSVMLKPMEQMIGAGRAEMTFVFSAASVCMTAGMLLGPRLYRRIAPVPLLVVCGLVAGVGLMVAARAEGLAQMLLGYGLLFGVGGGTSFVLVQQGMNQTIGTLNGLANGYLVGLYPLGAMIGAPLFGWSIGVWGLRTTLMALAVTVVVTSISAALLFRVARIRMQDATASAADTEARQWGLFARLFGVFFLAASAGLMVMSQAAGILQAYGAKSAFALGGTTFITGAIAAARIGGGWLVDRFPVPRVASSAHLIALCGSLLLLMWPSPAMAIPALTMVGMGYGFISGATAGSIARYWHRNAFGRVAGQMYIAWCVAAVTLPVIAGGLYDRTQGYHAAMMMAACVNLLGALLATTLPRRGATS